MKSLVAKVKVVQGDVYDAESLAAVMTGEDCVISCLGYRLKDNKEPVQSMDLYFVGYSCIINAMRQKGNKRLVVISSTGVEIIPTSLPTTKGPEKLFVWNQKNFYWDMCRMERIITYTSIDYAIFSP